MYASYVVGKFKCHKICSCNFLLIKIGMGGGAGVLNSVPPLYSTRKLLELNLSIYMKLYSS
jgi:hypothetical protein